MERGLQQENRHGLQRQPILLMKATLCLVCLRQAQSVCLAGEDTSIGARLGTQYKGKTQGGAR